MSAICARVCPRHVRCAIGVIAVSWRTQVTTSRVRWRVLPPAPYVTDTKLGGSGLGREELEGVRSPCREQVGDAGHARLCRLPAARAGHPALRLNAGSGAVR